MSASLTAAIGLYALGLAAWAACAPPGRGLHGGLIVLELALAGQALAALAGLALGYDAREPAVSLGYLVASVVILPATLPAARGGSRWDGAVVAVACVALAVVSLRLRATYA